ncbi:hypothetical protein CQW23_14847 [Capsicum baccatum]|uniref:NAC domain-containing protein n=1 Tax=Capsicum baccatum TaxID=33114 RepID=A0A2G2WKJ4_CAPBA|nr:hypothetical protein CQW23_14847 [Capsicum baccatum]
MNGVHDFQLEMGTRSFKVRNAHRSQGIDLGHERFRPIDEELISYLLKFVCGKPIECDHIRMLDLYGNKKPCDIFDDLSPDGEFTDVNYLFTHLTKKSTGGKNIKRMVLGGGGT